MINETENQQSFSLVIKQFRKERVIDTYPLLKSLGQPFLSTYTFFVETIN